MFDLDHLPNALPDEKLVYFLRRHWIARLFLYLAFFVILVAPFVTIWYLNTFQPGLLSPDQPMGIILVLGGSIFFLFAWLFLFQNYMDYHLDIWVVTNRRILNTEQTGLFGRTVSELRLYRIQDVTATVHGMLHTFFDFGDVEIQTAGEKERFRFEEVPEPNIVAKAILDLSEIDRREHLDEAVEEFGVAEQTAHVK